MSRAIRTTITTIALAAALVVTSGAAASAAPAGQLPVIGEPGGGNTCVSSVCLPV